MFRRAAHYSWQNVAMKQLVPVPSYMRATVILKSQKTSVTTSFQGRGIGRRLLLAALDAFKDLCGKKLYLETNTVLTSAIALYVSAGFVHAQRPTPSPYARANVYMEYRPSAYQSNQIANVPQKLLETEAASSRH
jgi:GNAT superfamily N-acetyltransferase